jgi:4-hydroxybenzoate polyprenyltransferase
LAINISYSVKLKNVPVIDILCIASGFTLRIIGGAFIIDVNVSSWLVLTTLFISLFLAIMKRRSELLHISHYANTRIVLKEYTESYLNILSTISATAVIVCYALYTVSDRTIDFFHTENLVYTIVFVIYGIFRFMFLILVKGRAENIADLLVKDYPLLINIGIYILFTYLIIYI